MKKISLLIVTFISLFMFMGNVFADASIECSAGGVTCTFTSKSGSLNGTCKNGDGKKYSAMNLNGHLDSKQNLSDSINNYSYQDISSCPGIMLIDDSKKNVIFVKGDGKYYVACPYAVEILGKTGLTCDTYEPNKPMVSATLDQTIDYINIVGDQLGIGSNYKSYSVTTGASQVGEDCDSQLQILYDKVVEKQTDVKNANCGYDVDQDNCRSLMYEWKNEITNSKNSASALLQSGVCTKAQLDAFNKRIGEETEDYNLIEQSRKKIEKENKGEVDLIDRVNDGCGGVFGDPSDPNYIAYYLQLIFNIMKFLGPVLVIVMSIIDLLKVTAEQKQDGELEKLGTKTFKRLIYAVIIFILPSLINYLFGLIGLYGTCGIS